ncbi:MAG: hypothetical protein RL131_1446 [Bacteroidota bacterium]
MQKILKAMMLILAVSIFSTAWAQDPKMGIRFGLNLASLSIPSKNANIVPGVKPNAVIGVYGEFKLIDKLDLGMEGLISGMGGTMKRGYFGTGSAAYPYANEINAYYFSLPVVLKYNVYKSLRVIGGGQLDMLLRDNVKLRGNDDAVFPFPVIGGNDIALTAGLEFTTKKKFSFQARYIHGLETITKFSPDTKYRTVQATFAYKLGK